MTTKEYSYTSTDPQEDPGLKEILTELGIGFVPGLSTAQALRDFERGRKSGSTLEMAASLASLVPGIGGVSKAALLLPAILRNMPEMAQALNRRVIPISSLAGLSKQQGRGVADIARHPAFHLADRKSFTPYGSEYFGDNEFRMLQPRVALVGKPGEAVPEKHLGHIFGIPDAGTTGFLETQGRKAALERDLASKADIAGWSTAKGFLEDQNNWWKPIEQELKMYQDMPIDAKNFSGVVVDPRNKKRLAEITNALRTRGLSTAPADFKDPTAVWDAANWLQQQSIK